MARRAFIPGAMPMRRLAIALGAMLAGSAVEASAQEPARWTLSWTDDAYRYVNGERVPVGPQSALLTVTPTRGDSVVATLPTTNPAITDTLDGTMTATRLVLRSRTRDVMARGPGSTPADGFRGTMLLELDLTGDVGSGTRRMQLSGPPGMRFPEPAATRVTAQRMP